MPLVLREEKGSKLTIAEMDGNLVYVSNDIGANIMPDNNRLIYSSTNGVRTQSVTLTSAIDFMGLGTPSRYAAVTFFNSTMTVTLTGFSNAVKLTSLQDIGTEVALDLRSCGMTDTIIDDLFTQLPSTTETATINVNGNPGAGTCDPTIATAKGYIVTT